MAKYTITVTNNEDGKIVLNEQANALIGALISDAGASTIVFEGTESETIAAVNVVQHAITRLFEEEG